MESDGQSVQAQLADWALNTSSPEGLQLEKLSWPTDWARAGAHQKARWRERASEENML